MTEKDTSRSSDLVGRTKQVVFSLTQLLLLAGVVSAALDGGKWGWSFSVIGTWLFLERLAYRGVSIGIQRAKAEGPGGTFVTPEAVDKMVHEQAAIAMIAVEAAKPIQEAATAQYNYLIREGWPEQIARTMSHQFYSHLLSNTLGSNAPKEKD